MKRRVDINLYCVIATIVLLIVAIYAIGTVAITSSTPAVIELSTKSYNSSSWKDDAIEVESQSIYNFVTQVTGLHNNELIGRYNNFLFVQDVTEDAVVFRDEDRGVVFVCHRGEVCMVDRVIKIKSRGYFAVMPILVFEGGQKVSFIQDGKVTAYLQK